MKFTVLRGFCLGGGVDVLPGDVIELANAEQLIRQGRVKLAPPEKVTAPVITDDEPKRKGATNARY